MANLARQDETHASLQLGRTRVVLDIPSSHAASFNPEQALAAPQKQLQMEWVHGSRGSDGRNNLLFLEATNELVYFMAAVVILHDTEGNSQRHYTEHTDDVKSIALHPDGNTLATGQVTGHRKVEGKAHVRVWRADTLETLHSIGSEGEFQRSVSCLAFSAYDRGELLCAVDEADDHHLSVWDWKAEKRLCQAKASKEPIMDVEFNPQEPNSIVSCGRGQISFWTIDDTRNLEAKRGTFKDNWKVKDINNNQLVENDKEAPKYILGLAFSPKGFLVSGDSGGNIIIWDKGRNKITRELTGAHTDAVFSLTFLRDGRLLSGGRAGRLVLWDEACQRKLLDTEVPPAYGAVRCAVQGQRDQLYLETVKNCLLAGTFADGFKPISVGHRDELWGLAVHPSGNLFLTCGDDRLVAMRDAETRLTVWEAQVKQGAHCCDLSPPDGGLAVVGCQTGHCAILDGATGSVLHQRKVSREQIEDARFSPDGQFLALASRDNKIYVLKVSNNGALESLAECQGHTSFVTRIDWSADGKLLRSNSGDYEILYWKMPGGQRELSDAVTRDAPWRGGACCLAFDVAGIWRDANDGTDVNAASVSPDGSLCAAGDDFGFVNLYAHPCPVACPERHRGKGHSSHVTNVAFSPDARRLITCGGRDMAVIQWRLV